MAVQPNNNSLPLIFSTAPNGTTVSINYGSTYEKTSTGWGEGDNAKINKGDILDVAVPATASGPLDLKIKGEYAKIEPRKVNFDCYGNGESSYIQSLMFEPKVKDPKIVFKDFFNTPALGSNLSISDNQNYFSYYWINSCVGEPCTSLNESQCNDTWGNCTWSAGEQLCKMGYPEYGENCGWWENYYDQSTCTRMGCGFGDPKTYEENYSYNGSAAAISIGSYISLSCVQDQNIHAELEENQSANMEYLEEITFENGYTKTFLLKNYSCYTFQSLYEKLFNSIKDLPEYYMYISCNRGNGSAYAYNYNYSWGVYNYYDDSSNMKIYQDTVCSAYISTNVIVQLTC